ncbi:MULTISPECIES: carboxylesterase family protein [Isoptericola]|uniref:Carboxylic ester hydrolase n=1 Tax=Isoptericola sediminis TaxID=2733572 RepID=A0A849JUH3_9MICO|nr:MULTISPECIES: carboxylesterase family protein [Isoptericola]MDO8144884.1 carboxylesterase family protein [Isoptericola sp. 178]MDO8152598.1 carboxylesterase family protein [Isoptericola sp. b408]NNU26234.1 carboxylesterase family protein [Isoptericola sediminis]
MRHRTTDTTATARHDRDDRVVDAPAGRFRASVGGDVLRAGGIRYARAARFSPPVDEPPAAGTVDATGFSPSSPQNPDPIGLDVFGPDSARPLPPSEDCLRLTVTAPADVRPGEGLPVIVWIHGGSYVSGAGDAISYDPSALVREHRVVVVAVTYRLGVLGFLGDDGRPANLGLRDMLSALRWVARNAEAFGGDPASVTVMGESAGADAITRLMVADGAAGLFRRAVVQSPPLGISRRRAQMAATMAAEVRGVPDDADLDELLAAQRRAVRRVLPRYGLRAAMPFGPQHGYPPVPPEEHLEAAWSRVAPDVDLLIGTNARETALFVEGVLPRTMVPAVGPALREGVGHGLTRAVYGRAVDQFVERHRRAGGRAARYTFLGGPTEHPLRAAHATELPLLLGDPESWRGVPVVAGRDDAELVASGRLLRGAWAQFARTGRPPTDIPGLLRVD